MSAFWAGFLCGAALIVLIMVVVVRNLDLSDKPNPRDMP